MYFYHLRLDLYPDRTTITPLLPPQGSSTQPQPQSYSLPSSTAQRSATFSSSSGKPQPQPQSAPASVDRFRSLFQPFPSPPAQTSGSSSALTSTSSSSSQTKRSSPSVNQHPEEDYRFGPIRVACFDSSTEKSVSSSSNHSRSRQSKSKKMATAAATAASTGSGFQESEPAQGILRLYKDKNEITTGNIHLSTQSDKDGASDSPSDREGAQIIQPDHGTTVSVLAVPSYMSPGDFLNFVGPVRSNVSHFRIIRDAAPNRFMVLMKFRTSEATDEFYSRYNGRTFNSMEPEICHVVYLKSIEIRAGCMPPYAFPFLNDDPFLQNHTAPTSITTPTLGANADQDPFGSSPGSITLHPKGASEGDTADSSALAELPTCPVCLERMDSSVTGLLTILCQHTFHCHCLSKWGEGSCPVCRYSQKTVRGPHNTQSNNLLSSSSTRQGDIGGGLTASTDGITEDQSVCALCGTTENLWICLICGHIGCGRYQEKHAYSHYYETSHLYALELETQRVWDYAGDGYVHRLIQNKTDGKLVELPSAVDGTLPSQHSVQVGQEKLDAIGLEYTYLLTSQLESQRLYFDAQMAAMTAQLAQLNKDATKWEKEAILLDQKNRELAQIAEALEKEKVPSLIKEKKAAEKRLEKMQEKLATMERLFEEEKEMSSGLLTNQKSFKDQLQEKEAEIAELQEQVRDMMIYLDTQQKIEQSSMKDELVNATIGVAPAPNAPSSSSSSPSVNHSRRKGRK
ncbi:BRCA1-associated protein [Entomortierella parvispora]|uniref:BRCA1-associated protein n=1 Tax=Entomortierella parvispora TaxID=205924 RepID=A0A9P3LTA8_9FUNG|nr:BRCA1-associated protein [Entomortierella parvispora]